MANKLINYYDNNITLHFAISQMLLYYYKLENFI